MFSRRSFLIWGHSEKQTNDSFTADKRLSQSTTFTSENHLTPSMKRSIFSIFQLLLLCHIASASTYYEVQGYLSSYSSNSLDKVDVEEYIQQNITPHLSNTIITINFIREIPNNPTVNFVAEVESRDNLQRNDVIEGFATTGTIHLITVAELQESSASSLHRVSVLSDSDGCENDGFRLPNGACQCKPFTSGTNCQTVNCQSWSALTQDGSHCNCPPGFSSQYCEQTGARPPVNADFDLRHRTFIVVISVNPSYWSTKQIVADNLEQTINALQAHEPGYIDSYVGMLVLGTVSNGVALGNTQSHNLTEFVQFLGQSNMSSPAETDGPQPILYALNYALNMNAIVRSHPVVLVFANREDTSTLEPTDSMDDQFQETKVHQSMLAWQAKIYFFISKDPHYNMDPSSKGYDAYRRIAAGSHGDLIAHEPSELPYLMKSFVPRLYKPEITSLLSYVLVNTVNMNIVKDFPDQILTVTVSIDRDQMSETNPMVDVQLTNGAGAMLKPDVSGKYVKLFTIPTSWTSISLSASANLIVSVRMFVSSDATFVFSYSPNQDIDSGLPVNIAEYRNYLHARPIGMPDMYSVYEQFLASNARVAMYDPNYGQLREGTYWNMNYEFPKIRLCEPGTYTQKFVVQQFGNPNITRLYPGMCFNAVHHANLAPSNGASEVAAPGQQDNEICTLKNNDALADSRLRDFRQIMFAVEVSSQMSDSLSVLTIMIKTLVSRLDSENQNRQYTLLMFDENNAYAAISTAYADQFNNGLVAEMMKARNATGTPSKTRSLDAIYIASQLILLSPAQLNIFTTSEPAGSNHNWILPRNLQVNWYYISPNMAMPSYSSMKLMEKQSGGRTVITAPRQIGSLYAVLKNSIYDNNLIFDNGYQDCNMGASMSFFVDQEFDILTLTLTGQNVRIVSLLDGGNNTINTSTNVDFSNNASLVVNIIQNIVGGKVTLTLATSHGQCFCQARVVSNFQVMLGFTSDSSSDFAAQQPTFRRGNGTSSAILARVVDKEKLYTMDHVEVMDENVDQPWLSGVAISKGDMIERDGNSCAYQYASTSIGFPAVNYIRVTQYATFKNNITIQRVFFYYTPLDNAPDKACNNGFPNASGECQCSPNYTGELCDQPVCQNGGINSNGVCDCADSGFIGTFCELVVIDNSRINTIAPQPGLSSTIKPTTQNTPKPNSASSIAIAFYLLFIIFV